MPLARILTRFPEHAGTLSQELRHRGYTVEFASPELAGKAPADLEIDFEICAEPDVLSRASELAEQLHADVAVSPGVVQYQEHGRTGTAEPNPAEPAAASRVAAELVAETEDRSRSLPEVAPAAQSSTPLEKASETMERAGRKSAAALQAAGVAVGELLASTRHWAREFWEAARHRSQEYSERVEVRRAETRAERQHKLLELEKRRVVAQERASELEVAREAAAARLQELLRERGGLIEAQPVPPQKTATTTASPAGKAGVFSRRISAYKVRLPFTRAYRPHMEAVLVGVAAACLLFVVGVAVASFHTRPAISNSLSEPSNGVTVQSGGVTVKTGSPDAAVNSNAPARPVAAPPAQSPGKPSATVRERSVGSDVTIRNFPAAKPNPRHARSTDRVSDDVTIRRVGPPGKAPAQASPRAELKRYSDLDN